MVLTTWRARHKTDRFYPGLERVQMSRAVRCELLLSQMQHAFEHQSSTLRPWQRYRPLAAFLDPQLWPDDRTVLHDLTFAKLAVELLTPAQREDLEFALRER